jgi:DNA modification methylase
VKRVDLDLDTDKAARELAFADNRIAQVSLDWAPEEIKGAIEIGCDLGGMFSQEELSKITGVEISIGSTDPDDVPVVAKDSRSKIGDLWSLGNHRVLCGDSSDPDAMARVLGGDMPCCVFTDPPYGVSIGKKNEMLNSFQPSGRNLEGIENDDLAPDELKSILLPIFVNVKNHAAEDCTFFVCAPQGGELGMMMMMMRESGLIPRHILIWKKNCATFSMGRLDYDYAHEPILLTWIKKHKRPMLGMHKTSVWEVDKPRACKEHPTMKPVELYVNAYLNNSDQNDVVFDPFGGSGTCIIAAEQCGRRGRVIELSPNYCDVILKRWSDFTGKDPVREDGAKWSETNND